MTTIVSVRRNGKVVMGGDGQVSLGNTVMKGNAKKVRRLYHGQVLAGFAGATADAFTLFERFEQQLEKHQGHLVRAAVELAKDWRTDRSLSRLEAMLAVANKDASLIITGNGDVVEPEHGLIAMGSGGGFAQAAALALLQHNAELSAREVAETALNIAGSRYFVEHAPITDPDDLDRRLRSGELSLAVEIPPNFGRDLKRGSDPAIGVWIDGAMPTRANTVLGYVQGLHTSYLADLSRQAGGAEASAAASTEVRYRYNPDVESLKAMVPAVIPLLLIMIPAMLTALGVVREKELGSITNLYVTPVTRLEFLVGKQLPYVAMGMINFLLMLVLAIVVFRVPLKGSFLALTIGAFLYVVTSTGLGLFLSTFMRSQIAAVFGVAIATMIPAIQFSGLIHPVSSLEGAAAWIGKLYPTSHFLVVSRGAFSKSLGLSDLWAYYLPLAASIVVLTLLSVACLKKQED